MWVILTYNRAYNSSHCSWLFSYFYCTVRLFKSVENCLFLVCLIASSLWRTKSFVPIQTSSRSRTLWTNWMICSLPLFLLDDGNNADVNQRKVHRLLLHVPWLYLWCQSALRLKSPIMNVTTCSLTELLFCTELLIFPYYLPLAHLSLRMNKLSDDLQVNEKLKLVESSPLLFIWINLLNYIFFTFVDSFFLKYFIYVVMHIQVILNGKSR